MSETLTRADLLKHESDGKDRLNKAKEEIYGTIQKDRHDSKNRDQILGYDISENKENIALQNQHQEFMNEKVSKIEGHVEEIKHLIEKQADTFATKAEHKNNEDRLSKLEKGVWWIIGLFATGIVGAIINLIIKTGNT